MKEEKIMFSHHIYNVFLLEEMKKLRDHHQNMDLKNMEYCFNNMIDWGNNLSKPNEFFRLLTEKFMKMGNTHFKHEAYEKALRLYFYAGQAMESIPKKERTDNDVKIEKKLLQRNQLIPRIIEQKNSNSFSLNNSKKN